jgi:hypothetical protein
MIDSPLQDILDNLRTKFVRRTNICDEENEVHYHKHKPNKPLDA